MFNTSKPSISLQPLEQLCKQYRAKQQPIPFAEFKTFLNNNNQTKFSETIQPDVRHLLHYCAFVEYSAELEKYIKNLIDKAVQENYDILKLKYKQFNPIIYAVLFDNLLYAQYLAKCLTRSDNPIALKNFNKIIKLRNEINGLPETEMNPDKKAKCETFFNKINFELIIGLIENFKEYKDKEQFSNAVVFAINNSDILLLQGQGDPLLHQIILGTMSFAEDFLRNTIENINETKLTLANAARRNEHGDCALLAAAYYVTCDSTYVFNILLNKFDITNATNVIHESNFLHKLFRNTRAGAIPAVLDVLMPEYSASICSLLRAKDKNDYTPIFDAIDFANKPSPRKGLSHYHNVISGIKRILEIDPDICDIPLDEKEKNNLLFLAIKNKPMHEELIPSILRCIRDRGLDLDAYLAAPVGNEKISAIELATRYGISLNEYKKQVESDNRPKKYYVIKKQYDAAQNKVDKLKEDIKKEHQSYKDMRSKYDMEYKSHQETKKDLKRVRKERDNLLKEKKDLKSAKKDLKASLAKKDKEVAEKTQDYQSKLVELERKLAANVECEKAKLDKIKDLEEKLLESKQTFQSDLDISNNKCLTLENKNTELGNTIKLLQENQKKLMQDNNALQKDHAVLEKNLVAEKKKYETMQSELDKVKKNFEEERTNLADENYRLTCALKEEEQEQLDLQKKIDELNHLNELLCKQLASKNKKEPMLHAFKKQKTSSTASYEKYEEEEESEVEEMSDIEEEKINSKSHRKVSPIKKKMSDEQAESIGAIGERLAYNYLFNLYQKRYQHDPIEKDYGFKITGINKWGQKKEVKVVWNNKKENTYAPVDIVKEIKRDGAKEENRYVEIKTTKKTKKKKGIAEITRNQLKCMRKFGKRFSILRFYDVESDVPPESPTIFKDPYKTILGEPKIARAVYSIKVKL